MQLDYESAKQILFDVLGDMPLDVGGYSPPITERDGMLAFVDGPVEDKRMEIVLLPKGDVILLVRAMLDYVADAEREGEEAGLLEAYNECIEDFKETD